MENILITGIWYHQKNNTSFITFKENGKLYITDGTWIKDISESNMEQLIWSQRAEHLYTVFHNLQSAMSDSDITIFLNDAISEKDATVKTLDGWERFAKCGLNSWMDYCQKNDLASEEAVDYFMENEPSVSRTSACAQPAGAIDTRFDEAKNVYRDTYLTFTRINHETWRYCGDCFKGETVMHGKNIIAA